MEYQIREMTVSDWPEVRRIYQEGMDTNIATFQTTCPPYEEWDRAHLKQCRLVIIAENQVVGWTALSPVSSRCVYTGVAEVSIYIDSNYQGKGTGTKLLNAVIRLSEENDIWTLQSGIMRENSASVRLHEKCGFRMVGYREKIGCDRFGQWRDNFLMEKRSQSERCEGCR
jgi:L-amino acid N-acyltransferase YncA